MFDIFSIFNLLPQDLLQQEYFYNKAEKVCFNALEKSLFFCLRTIVNRRARLKLSYAFLVGELARFPLHVLLKIYQSFLAVFWWIKYGFVEN
jgi:hypothetical protein